MSTSIPLPQPRLGEKNTAYSIPSSSSEKMGLLPLDTKPPVYHNPAEVPAGIPQGFQPGNPYPNAVPQELVFLPPQSKFPIRICSVHGCGIILTQKDGNRPVCQRHAIEIDMLRKRNPYPRSRPSPHSTSHPSSHPPFHRSPQPGSSSRHGKERGRENTRAAHISVSSVASGQAPRHVNMGPPRHKLHALTAEQCSLLMGNGNGVGTVDPHMFVNHPAKHFTLPHPQPPSAVNSYPPIPERLNAEAIEAAIAHRRLLQRAARRYARDHLAAERAVKAQKAQNTRDRPASGAEYPFAGDANGRTIYRPHTLRSSHVKPANPIVPLASSAPIQDLNPYPLIQPVDTADSSSVHYPIAMPKIPDVPSIERHEMVSMAQRRAVSLPLGSAGPANSGEKKRKRGGSVSEVEDERPRRHEAPRSTSEPLPLSIPSSSQVKVEGWPGDDIDVDVKEVKEIVPIELDLVTAVGNAVHVRCFSFPCHSNL
ncbi:hypothetical protein L218DRAFT_353055 [Marasmius fiardii PR-910]|nr:hypothetical protein L218DRAFT_353055 [Marasmius fiardii PR-910]